MILKSRMPCVLQLLLSCLFLSSTLASLGLEPSNPSTSTSTGRATRAGTRGLKARRLLSRRQEQHWRAEQRREARQLLEAAAASSQASADEWHKVLGFNQPPASVLQGDNWCQDLPDGFHADSLADPPCSGYFRCRKRMLVGLHPCPQGTEYSTPAQACVAPALSSCSQLGATRGRELGEGQGLGQASDGSGSGRSILVRATTGSGLNYRANEALLNESTSLLDFKQNVLDFNNVLLSWTPARTTSTGGAGAGGAGGGGVGVGPPATCASGLPCAGAKACWSFIKCSPLGSVVELIIPPANLSTPLGTNAIPMSFSQLTSLRSLILSGKGADDQSIAEGAALFGLSGTLPRELSTLRRLTLLDMSYNHLTGTLEESGVLFMTALKQLRLANNYLTGIIPQGISRLVNLEFLDLSRNGFGGALPTALASLAKLTEVYLSGNLLTGQIAPEVFPLSLAYLSLDRNSFRGSLPASFSRLASLSSLVLAYNELAGPVPESIARLESLQNLDLSGNMLNGTLPLKESCGPAMNTLSLAVNRFTGSLSAADVAGCGATLGTLNVSSNQLTGSLPEAFFTMLTFYYFVTFSANDNKFTGPIPRSLARHPVLMSTAEGVTIELSNNQLSGQIPPGFACYRSVNLDGNLLTGGLPSSMLCANASYLDVSRNQLSGGVSAVIASARPGFSPKELNLASNRFTGPAPALPAAQCTNLTSFNLTGNAFSGPLPDLSGCSFLVSLDLSNSSLSGPLDPARIPRGALGALDLSGNALSGPLDPRVGRLTSLQALDLSGNQLSGLVPSNISSLKQLTMLDLSGNMLSSLPLEIGNLTLLRKLDVSGNLMNGSIPVTLAPPGMKALTFLDLSRNLFGGNIPFGFQNTSSKNAFLNFSTNLLCGKVPPGPLNSTFPASVFANNTCANPSQPLCNGTGLPPCPAPSPGSDGGSSSSLSAGAVVGIVLGSLAVLLLLLGLLWCALFYRRRASVWEGGTMLVFEKMDVPLTIHQVLDSTEGFDEQFMLGRGGFGSVYRGTLADGRTVAIKRLAAGSGQGQKEFQAEMQTLGNIRHRNLVVLIAAYVTRPPSNEKLLIYEFLSGGSMDRMLTKDLPKDSPFRQWGMRRKVIEDVARGLKYLHHDCTPRIVHRDMKPANVLLDDRCSAKVADFGLAREFDMTKSHVSTSVFGTIGYLAPEYTTRGRLSFKSDVFAFGVMVLQVVTGKQPTDADVAERGLARWVSGSSALSVCDPRIEDSELHLSEIMGVITLGLRCTSRVPSDRPSMEEVVYSLDHLNDFARGFGKGKISPEDKVKDL